VSIKARRKYSRIVQQHKVVGAEQVGKLPKDTIRETASDTV
jgi:hypothetical protein